jgi:hypothetical protein
MDNVTEGAEVMRVHELASFTANCPEVFDGLILIQNTHSIYGFNIWMKEVFNNAK